MNTGNLFGMGSFPNLGAFGNQGAFGNTGANSMGLDPNTIAQMMVNPQVQQMISQMMSDPQLMQQIMGNNPMIQNMMNANPQLRDMLSNPQFMQQLANPQMIQAALQMQQSLGQFGMPTGGLGTAGFNPGSTTSGGQFRWKSPCILWYYE